VILAPGTLVGDWSDSEGTFGLVLRRGADAGVYFASAAHVLAYPWIEKAFCATDETHCLSNNPFSDPSSAPSVVARSAGPFAGEAAPAPIGPLVQQSCLKLEGVNCCDAAIAQVTQPSTWEILSVPFVPGGQQYLLLPDDGLLSLPSLAGKSIIRFGAKTGPVFGSIVGTVASAAIPRTPDPGSITYASLVTYTSTPVSAPGDSGALVCLVRSADLSANPLEIVPFALHVGTFNDTLVCCRLDLFLGQTGFQIAYDSPAGG
jgi:hypothetical protein